MVTHGEKANSGHSSGHFWNYVNVLCKKGLQGKRENPWDKGTFTQVSEVKSSKWSLPTESSCSPPSPGEAVLRKAAMGFWSPGWLLTGSACSLTVKEKPRIILRQTRDQDAETEVALSAERAQESSSVFKGTVGIAITRLSTRGQTRRELWGTLMLNTKYLNNELTHQNRWRC